MTTRLYDPRQLKTKRNRIKIDDPTLIKYTGTYLFENGNSSLHNYADHIINVARRVTGYQKKFLQPNSNKVYRIVHKTLNQVDRMYDSVGREMLKKYPNIEISKMPKIRIDLVDRTQLDSYHTSTSNALGCAEYNSTHIQLKAGFIARYNKMYSVGIENLIMHELGHAVFGLRHCRKRKNVCPIMHRYMWYIQNDDVVLKNKQRTRFKRFIRNKYYSKGKLTLYESYK
jgi:predicted Zn-dependent protease